MSIIAPLVLPPPQPQGYSPHGSFVALFCRCGLSPGSRRCWMVAAPPLLAGSGFVAQELLDLSCHFTPLCAQDLQTQVCLYWRSNFLHADWQVPHLLCFVCFTLLWSAKRIKEAFVEAADSLFHIIEILSSIKALQLSRSTVSQHISLELDESTDIIQPSCVFLFEWCLQIWLKKWSY